MLTFAFSPAPSASKLPFISTELFFSMDLKSASGKAANDYESSQSAPSFLLFIFLIKKKNGLVARTICNVWGFGHNGRLVHHPGSILMLSLYKMVPGLRSFYHK